MNYFDNYIFDRLPDGQSIPVEIPATPITSSIPSIATRNPVAISAVPSTSSVASTVVASIASNLSSNLASSVSGNASSSLAKMVRVYFILFNKMRDGWQRGP